MSEEFDAKKVELTKYEKEYTPDSLWDKIGKVAKKAGIKVVYYALLLYYALQSENVTLGEKTRIIGALGYFILPIDLIPDVLIPLGYVDDTAVMLALIKTLACIDEEVKAQAQEKLTDWFGNYDKKEIE